MVEIEADSYQRHLIQPNFNFGYKFEQGWLFGRVHETELIPVNYEEWASIDTVSEIAFDTIKVTKGGDSYDLFWVKKENQIWQVFQGWNDPNLRIFIRFPESIPRGGIPNEIGNPGLDNEWGWLLEGRDSLIDAITVRGQFFLPYQRNIEFGIYNPALYRIQPVTKFIINIMKFTPYDPAIKAHLEKIIGMLKGKIQATLYTPGIAPFDYSDFKKVYKIDPVEWDGAIAKIGGSKVIEGV